MQNLELEFYECEHNGDLDYYLDDIIECGGKIVSSSVDHDSEIGHVVVAVKNRKEFITKFQETDASQFLN